MKSTIGTIKLLCLLFIGALLMSKPVVANVALSKVFGDHMILQRDALVPIWGFADPGENVTVVFARQKKSTVADSSGKWMIYLDKIAADASPQNLTVTGKNILSVSDVLVGDVWICAGQSNMTYRLGFNMAYNSDAVAAANDPNLRNFSVGMKTATAPLDDLMPDGSQYWVPANPNSAQYIFSAVGYYFGAQLRKALGSGVPIGLVQETYPATPAEPWVSSEGLGKDPALAALRDKMVADMVRYPADQARYPSMVEAWEDKYDAKDQGNSGEAQGWAEPDFDDSTWKTVDLWMNFNKIGMKAGGSVWLRKTVNIPASSAGKGFDWRFQWSTDDYTPYFNGVKLDEVAGQLPKFNMEARSFHVPANLVHEGSNTLAIRVFSHTDNGNVGFNTSQMQIPCDPSASDANTWRYFIEFANPQLPPGAVNAFPKAPYAVLQYTATYLYNAMVNPIIPIAAKGVIWYQGESNQGRAYQYRKVLPALISDWRTRWHNPNMPFYIVQLSSYGPVSNMPQDTNWPVVRESQLLTATHDPASGLAVTIDIGAIDDIHPKDKLDVGKRLARIALAKTYGQNIEYSGPLYVTSAIEGSSIRIKFLHVGGGLAAKDGPLKQFAIAGADKKFVWADATIVGDSVVVSSPQVPSPVAVRYAWADSPVGCNLYNAAGLPASPFRTDDWPVATEGP